VKASDGTALTYRYDHNGLRTHKIVTEGDTVTTWLYTLNGKQVAHLKVTTAVNGVTTETKDLHFYYDAQERPGIVRVGTSSVYTYVYDLQGDVVGLLDSTGAKVVEYHYDAWGKKLYASGSLAGTLGKLNPFRYRGYVYDEETGFYYLRSRYYNPRWGRFVNDDACYYHNSLSLNLSGFAYCKNNPVVFCDMDGYEATIAIEQGLPLLEKIFETVKEYVVPFIAVAVAGSATGKWLNAQEKRVKSNLRLMELVSSNVYLLYAIGRAYTKACDPSNPYTSGRHDHHIVPKAMPFAEPARFVLESAIIGINDNETL